MKNVYTVGQVNAYIKNMFAQDYMLRSIIVSGEASNVKYHSSGHVYFTMKDKNGALSCVMFAGYTNALKFRLTDGMQIEASGSVSVYERSGSYQLYVTAIRMAGAGALYEKYERLKAELLERGMFDEIYKQPIPKYAKRIGVVTASTGAAIQDILQISARRNPYVQVILYPAQVQGEGAKESIVAGINALSNQNVDVIIVGRGGGSIEDLWAFNEECVAEAIFNCPIPIVSAVGHETDTTIADYVADLRAPTPSAAAELTVFSYDEFCDKLSTYQYRLRHEINSVINDFKGNLNNKEARMDSLSPQSKIKFKRLTYMNMLSQMESLMQGKLLSSKNRLTVAVERLKGASPLERISHGYAYISDDEGNMVNDVNQINEGDYLKLTMKNGHVETEVKKTVVIS